MPWRKMSVVDQRLEFVVDLKSGLWSMTELCTAYGISRKTGYKWASRFGAEGPLALVDRPRRPHHSPQATRPEVVEALITSRRRHPRWGAKKFAAVAGGGAPGVDLALGEHGKPDPGAPRPAEVAAAPASSSSWAEIAHGECGAQRCVDGGLQGEVPNAGWRVLPPVDNRRRLLALFAVVRRVARADDSRHTGVVRTAVPAGGSSAGDPDGQRDAVCREGSQAAFAPGGVVDSAGDRAGAHRASAP